VVDGPFDLLSRNQDLAEKGVDLCFARVKTSRPSDVILVFEDVSDA